MFERWKVSWNWILAAGGVRKWASDKVFHMPERYLPGWCELLTSMGIEMTPEQWRIVEARLVEVLYDGLVLRVQ